MRPRGEATSCSNSADKNVTSGTADLGRMAMGAQRIALRAQARVHQYAPTPWPIRNTWSRSPPYSLCNWKKKANVLATSGALQQTFKKKLVRNVFVGPSQ